VVEELDVEDLIYPVSIDIEFVPKPGDVEDLVYRVLSQNSCIKSVDIKECPPAAESHGW